MLANKIQHHIKKYPTGVGKKQYPMTTRFVPGDLHLNPYSLEENMKDYFYKKID